LESLIRLLSEQIAASSAASPGGLATFERALGEHTAALERSAYVPVLPALEPAERSRGIEVARSLEGAAARTSRRCRAGRVGDRDVGHPDAPKGHVLPDA
jgi:hypothetical protein